MVEMLHEPYAWAEITYRQERLKTEADQQRLTRRARAGRGERKAGTHRRAA
jgi:hypothetical protein